MPHRVPPSRADKRASLLMKDSVHGVAAFTVEVDEENNNLILTTGTAAGGGDVLVDGRSLSMLFDRMDEMQDSVDALRKVGQSHACIDRARFRLPS